jgi:hypothetical protein
LQFPSNTLLATHDQVDSLGDHVGFGAAADDLFEPFELLGSETHEIMLPIRVVIVSAGPLKGCPTAPLAFAVERFADVKTRTARGKLFAGFCPG